MARPKRTPDDSAAGQEPRKKLTAADKLRLKLARIMGDISLSYREAATALRLGDNDAYESAVNVIEKYAALGDELTKKLSDAITAEGLNAVTE